MNSPNKDDIESIEVARLFHAAFDHLQHGVIIYDSELTILEINDRVRELLEISEDEAKVGDSFEKVIRLNASRGGYGGTGSAELRIEWRLKRARSFEPFHEDQQLFNGRHCEVYGQPVPGGGYVLTYTDISDRVHAEEAKRQFLAKMSHDIRTPLNGVVGMAELLEMSELAEPQERMVNTIMRSSKVLLRLIDDILDLAKIESGKLQLENETFTLSEVLTDIVSTLQVIATKNNVFLRLEIDPDVPDRLYGDSVRLAQCVINLVGNAIKYSTQTDNGTTKPVDIKVFLAGPDQYCIRVRDDGIGISESQLENMFQPFVQGTLIAAHHVDGSGLGLSIVAELTQLMGGEVSVESAPGKGSSFTLTLPLVVMTTDDNESAVNESEPDEKKASSPTPKILVVEDNYENQEALRLQLDVLGCEVDVAENGEHGLQCWRENQYDMILSDWNMPVLNGLEMVKTLRKEESQEPGKRIPVVGITGNAIPGEVDRCLDAGMDDYLTKPLTLADLRGKLEQHLHQTSKQD